MPPVWTLRASWDEGTRRAAAVVLRAEYVFSYGPSLSYLKVVLSTVALNLFSTHGLEPVRLATHVAEWALLMGQVCGTVRPSGDLVLSSCYEYCRRQAVTHSGVSPR